MATIYICDGCRQKLNSLGAIRFWGSKKLDNLIFCEGCFSSIEKYVINRYKIQIKEKMRYEQKRS